MGTPPLSIVFTHFGSLMEDSISDQKESVGEINEIIEKTWTYVLGELLVRELHTL